jgi:proline iminopeptidase
MPPDAGIGRADPFAPLTSELLPVGDGHDIHVESIGREGGIPAVYLHGGPGSGCQPDHRRLFDPERFHAVLFDQRGSGRSRPKGRREHNTLQHLIADMETIREKFGFEKWMVVGGCDTGAGLCPSPSRPRLRPRVARDVPRHPQRT